VLLEHLELQVVQERRGHLETKDNREAQGYLVQQALKEIKVSQAPLETQAKVDKLEHRACQVLLDNLDLREEPDLLELLVKLVPREQLDFLVRRDHKVRVERKEVVETPDHLGLVAVLELVDLRASKVHLVQLDSQAKQVVKVNRVKPETQVLLAKLEELDS